MAVNLIAGAASGRKVRVDATALPPWAEWGKDVLRIFYFPPTNRRRINGMFKSLPARPFFFFLFSGWNTWRANRGDPHFKWRSRITERESKIFRRTSIVSGCRLFVYRISNEATWLIRLRIRVQPLAEPSWFQSENVRNGRNGCGPLFPQGPFGTTPQSRNKAGKNQTCSFSCIN